MKRICFLLTCTLLSSGTAFAQDGRSIYHLFPQFVDGQFSDGTYYRSSLMWSNVNSTATTNGCVLNVRGVITSVKSARFGSTVSIGAPVSFDAVRTAWDVLASPGIGNLQVGFAGLACAQPVNAQVVYSFYTANGAKLSEATALSSPPSQQLQLLVEEQGGARLGIAIANDNDAVAAVTITVYNAQEAVIGGAQTAVAPRTQIARFLSEMVGNIPPEFVGRVSISSSQPVSAIGLKFTGGTFTTVPVFVRP